jgi:D-amino-acid oxidase
MELAERIMQNAIRVCPDLVPPGAGIESLNVLRHQIGFRPYRKGGPRVDMEVSEDNKTGSPAIIHAYGVGGTGYQLSYGVANKVVRLVSAVSVKNSQD